MCHVLWAQRIIDFGRVHLLGPRTGLSLGAGVPHLQGRSTLDCSRWQASAMLAGFDAMVPIEGTVAMVLLSGELDMAMVRPAGT